MQWLCFNKGKVHLCLHTEPFLSMQTQFHGIFTDCAQTNESARSARDRTGGACGAGGLDGLLHCPRTTRLCAGPHKSCDGTPRLCQGPIIWTKNSVRVAFTLVAKLSTVKCYGTRESFSGRQHLTAGVGPPPWLVPGSLSDVPGPGGKSSVINQTDLTIE